MRRFLKSRFVARYGTVLILLLLGGYFSLATIAEQHPTDVSTARALGRFLAASLDTDATVLVVVRGSREDAAFAAALAETLTAESGTRVSVVAGDPRDARQRLDELGRAGTELDAIATHHFCARWGVLSSRTLHALASQHPSLDGVRVVTPAGYTWPVFLSRANLLSVLNQISVIAIIAIGMTMVIITGGIDLSVGSLMALAGVVAAWAISAWDGAGASPWQLALCCLLAVHACAAMGLLSGLFYTRFGVPSFIATLGVMSIARGLAFKVAGGPSPVPIEAAFFHRLGAGTDILGIPNPVTVMALLYLAAYVVMSHTTTGRYIYAVGGNPEAARLSGVPVKRVLVSVYVICAALAGLGGVMDAALFSVGNPNSGRGYELQIIAAVVVGGTSLSGGEGKVQGTLIGALILGVISNGMYLTKVDAYTQMVVFGVLILMAVLLDQLKSR